MTFDFGMECKWVLKNEQNPIGFRTRRECFESITQLRQWRGLEDLKFFDELYAEKQGLGFLDALKCRWMRKQPEWTQDKWEQESLNCLESIESQRKLVGARLFNPVELAQLHEPRYTSEGIEMPKTWDKNLIESHDKQYNHLKTWLDQGGDVNLGNTE